MALKRLCKANGCHNLAEYPNRYCDKHKSLEIPEKGQYMGGNYQDYEKPWAKLYNSQRWRETSKNFLKMNPYCCKCGNRATVVDHIIPHRGNEDLFWNENNYQPLCDSCHKTKTLREMAQRAKEKNEKYIRDRRIGKLWY